MAVDSQRNLRVRVAGVTEMTCADQDVEWPRTPAHPGFDGAMIGSGGCRLCKAAAFGRQRPSRPREPAGHAEPVPVDADGPRPAQLRALFDIPTVAHDVSAALWI